MSDKALGPSKWTRPDEFMRMQRLKQKKKQLTERLVNKNTRRPEAKPEQAQLLEPEIAQKRKNPFAKSTENGKKPKILAEEDSLLDFINTPTQKATEEYVRETPTRPPAAKLVLQPFDPTLFAKLMQQSSDAAADDDAGPDNQVHTKHLPMDWSLKTRARFFCESELPSTTLKTGQMASGLTSFVRCIDTKKSDSSLDISEATRFNQATYYWQHPHLPWLTLFPRNSKENTGITVGERERKALAEEWGYSFRGLFQLLRARQCPYFYLCANTFTVLFRAAGIGGCVETHALLTPSTRGMRSALRQEGIEYKMPLKKDAGLNKSGEGSFTEESSASEATNNLKENENENEEKSTSAVEDDDEEDEEGWLESLGVDKKEIRKIQTAHARKIKQAEMSEDFSDNSLLLIEGVECQGFFSYLLNAKSTIMNVGRLAGVPPTLIAPVAFPKATMQQLTARSNKVRLDGVDYRSIDVKGIVLPNFLPYICQLLNESKNMYSVTLGSHTNTLAFGKATQKILEAPKQSETCDDRPDRPVVTEKADTASHVFGQENLSDCGLLPEIVEAMCRTGKNAVSLLERVCYNQGEGYAWS